MISSPLTAQAITHEIARIVSALHASTVYEQNGEHTFLDWCARKGLQIFWQEYAMSCGASAYATWKEATEQGDINALGEWCAQYMDDEQDETVVSRVQRAVDVVSHELLQRKEKEYSEYQQFVASLSSFPS
jgi:hypothetical protein